MSTLAARTDIEVFATCPQSKDLARPSYLQRVVDVARWSEAAGCRGILVYTDNGLVDPWLVSQVILQNTATLAPLVAVQPVYMHPYAVAKMVTSLGFLHSRRLYLNMLAGGFKNDLLALDDDTPHDRRYDRTVEYTRIVQLLCEGSQGTSFAGEFYRVRGLKLTPALPAELQPGFMVSGSSPAGLAAARSLGAVAVKYPAPAEQEAATTPLDGPTGVRLGIICRADADAAWAVAERRFPADRKGQLAHQLAMKTSDSSWHRQLAALGQEPSRERNPYWLHPFENYHTFCPYLVGSYEQVAAELGRYLGLGHRTFILDIPADEHELGHTFQAFEKAAEVQPR